MNFLQLHDKDTLYCFWIIYIAFMDFLPAASEAAKKKRKKATVHICECANALQLECPEYLRLKPLTAQSSGWSCHSHSTGISPLFFTVQSGPQGSDLGNIPPSLSIWEHQNDQEFLLRRPHPLLLSLFISSVPSRDIIPLWLIYPRAPPTGKRSFLREKTPFVRIRHLLDMRHKTLHFSACLSVSPSLLCQLL